MNHSSLRWYTVSFTLRNVRTDPRYSIEVSASSEADALRRAREHVRTYRRSRIFHPAVAPSRRII